MTRATLHTREEIVRKKLRIGDRVRRISTILDIARKQGRSGELWFLAIGHDYLTARGMAVTGNAVASHVYTRTGTYTVTATVTVPLTWPSGVPRLTPEVPSG